MQQIARIRTQLDMLGKNACSLTLECHCYYEENKKRRIKSDVLHDGHWEHYINTFSPKWERLSQFNWMYSGQLKMTKNRFLFVLSLSGGKISQRSCCCRCLCPCRLCVFVYQVRYPEERPRRTWSIQTTSPRSGCYNSLDSRPFTMALPNTP